MKFFLQNNKTGSTKPIMKLGALGALSAVFFLAISCASVPREVALSGLFDHFEKAPQVLVKTENNFLRDMAASFNDSTIEALMSVASDQKDAVHKPIDRDRLDKTLMRADMAGIGISWDGNTSPAIEVVLAGNFPSLLTSLSFSFDNNWERIVGGYAAKNGKLYLRKPSGGQLHFATWAPEDPPAFSGAAGSMARSSGMLSSDADLTIYLDAKSALVTQLPILDGVTLPFDGIMLSATRDAASPAKGSPDARYSTVFQIQMKDEQAARTYKPIIKFMWVLISNKLSSYGVPLSSENSIEQRGSLFVSQPITMSAQQMIDAMLELSNLDGNTTDKIIANR
ncbi:MAG: hypothetical protein ABFC85_09845 [Rectinema sp.]|jgi:hypothetical protein